MNLVAIEKSDFNLLNENMEEFFMRFHSTLDKHKEKRLGEWLDNDDVCKILGICVRTLQNLRRTGIIGYTKICNKTYYRMEDVEEAMTYLNARK